MMNLLRLAIISAAFAAMLTFGLVIATYGDALDFLLTTFLMFWVFVGYMMFFAFEIRLMDPETRAKDDLAQRLAHLGKK